ncbi:spore germination protein [Paenibacillus cellulositrophicus]|uniref:spore germination protein n=1 Tax=Paenibacillus cellulositrophicus TaxID=562959 RepID=UPI003F80F1E5
MENTSIQESSKEAVIAGPHDGFVENIAQNIGLIRNRIKSEHLKTFKLTVGSVTKTDVVLVYLDDIVNKELLEDIKNRLQAIRIKAIYGTPMVTQ